MITKIIKGETIQRTIFELIGQEIAHFKKVQGATPGIAFIGFEGHTPLMKYVVKLHEQSARGLGFYVQSFMQSSDHSEEVFFPIIEQLNHNSLIHAILVLQPMPKHIQAFRLIERIDVHKEVEGFHPLNLLETLIYGMNHTRYPMCLPSSFLELFRAEGLSVSSGSQFVFAADQDFISAPFRSMILRTAASQVIPSGCAFTIVDIENEWIADYCRRADYLFVVSEHPGCIRPEWLKPGVCIVDIYSNLVKEVPSKQDPTVMVPVIRGGVNTDSVQGIAACIAPCPGGLMPVLLAVLLRNALMSFKLSLEEPVA